MKRRGRLAAPSFFNNDDFRSSASNATCTSASSLLHPNTASGIRGGDVPHAFGDDFFSGHESVRGSSLSSSSHFGYSQKSFHTSDGNLYSVFSPLQGQRSRSRPSSFLRQHLQQQHEQQHPGQSHAQSSNQTPHSSSAASNSNRNADQQQQKWRFQVREERSSNDNQSTTGSSRLFREESRGDDDEWFNRHDDIFSKEKERFYQRSESPVFSRWPREEERLDISSLLKSKFTSSSNATTSGGGGLFDRQDSWSDDEEDGPLNLCLADRRRRRKSSSSSSKSDLEDHHHLRRRRRHQTASDDIASFFKHDFLLKDDHSTNFRLRKHYHHQEDEREVEEEEDTFFNTRLSKEGCANEEPKVLDLSMKNEATSSKRNYDVNATPQQAPPPPQQNVHRHQDGQKISESSKMDTEKWQKNAIPPNRKQFPRISEMLEKMHLRDDEWRQAMQVDSYRAALESTRERLIHTHPEMFIGWPPDGDTANKMDIAFQQQQTKVNENPNFCKQGASNLQQMHQDVQRRMPTTSNLLQTPSRTTSGVKCEEETRSLPPLLVATPLRSCSAVTVNAEMVSKAQPRPLAGSFSCPEVPSLVNRGIKSRWMNQKGERPKGRPPRKSSAETAIGASSTITSSVSPFANDISICKFKLVKGLHPVLEEKKTLHVPLPVRSSPNSSPQRQSTPILETSSGSNSEFQFICHPNSPSSNLNRASVSKESPLKTFKFHMEGQNSTEVGGGGVVGGVSCRATSPGGVQGNHNRRVRKRSRKTLAREQLEATFREQGFLIKTQQVSSAEGAVYCKFRQLKKFTRYLFKSWKDHLPLEIQGGVENNNMQSSSLPPQATLLNENTSTI